MADVDFRRFIVQLLQGWAAASEQDDLVGIRQRRSSKQERPGGVGNEHAHEAQVQHRRGAEHLS